MFQKSLLSFLFVSIFIGALAQGKIDYLKLGDSYYKNKDYYAAYTFYQKVLDDIPPSDRTYIPYQNVNTNNKPRLFRTYQEVVYKLGESARMLDDTKEAENWYAKAKILDNNFDFPLSGLYLAKMQLANSKYSEANKTIDEFSQLYIKNDEYKVEANRVKESILFSIHEYNFPRLLNVFKLDTTTINQPGQANYASFIKNSDSFIVFTTTRNNLNGSKISEQFKNQIAISQKKEEGWNEPVYFGIEGLKGFEQSTISFNENFTRAYFTQWKKVKGNLQSFIVVSNYKNGKWSKPEKLNEFVNEKKSEALQPFYYDGKLLFTSSKKGSIGGNDIWLSNLDSNGMPINSINLGFRINTIFNEEAAIYIPSKKTFYYSTNGKTGLGGYDNFVSVGDILSLSTPINLGLGINSGKDDLYINFGKEASTSGYISSDRLSACCLELFKFEKLFYAIQGKVVDDDGGLGVSNAKVYLIDESTGQNLDSTVTNNDGKYFMDIKYRKKYSLKAVKKGFFSAKQDFSVLNVVKSDTSTRPDLRLKGYVIEQPYVIENIFYDFDKATLRPESIQSLDSLFGVLKANPDLVVEIGSHTDSKGNDDYNIQLSEERAKSVIKYLINKGINPSLLVSKGYGESMPVAPNNNKDGSDNSENRQLNRRTEFKIKAVRE